MANMKATKRALLASAMALIVCFAMLLGTTYAWFTDSVTSGSNIIQSGTLKVDLVDAAGNSMKGQIIEFVTKDGRDQSKILWEPGCTYETEPVYVENKGNLDLKYEIIINGIVGNAKLLEAIEWTVTVGTTKTNLEDLKGTLAAGKKSEAIVLSGHMKEEAGNEYQGLTAEGISISVIATQLTSEKDSFDDQYDDITLVSTAAELKEALEAGKHTMLANDIVVDSEDSYIIVPADADVILDMNGYDIAATTTKTDYTQCVITVRGKMNVIGNGTASITTGTLNAWSYRSAVFSVEANGELTLNEGVTLVNKGDFDMAFGVDVLSGSGSPVLNINGATIISPYTGVRLFNNSDVKTTTVNYNSGVVYGETRDIWAQKASSKALPENAKVNIADGITYETTTQESGGVIYQMESDVTYAFNADSLASAIKNGGVVVLAADISGVDANTAITVASGADITLDLNGHTISATADKTGNQEVFLVKGKMTVKNGSLELEAKNNQGWNAMATIFDVTAGGALDLDGVTAKVGGTDMNFIVHLNNWGSATLVVKNCDFTASYVAIRAFNSGYDMNTVTVKNTDFHTGRVFWVHNYTAEGKDDSTLTLDIYGNGNNTDNEKPVRFGFTDSVYYDINGNLIP